MNTFIAPIRLVGLLAMMLVTGCAPAYHDNSGCRIDCQYCTPPPLPFTQFDCACHSCAASPYLASPHRAPDATPSGRDADVDR